MFPLMVEQLMVKLVVILESLTHLPTAVHSFSPATQNIYLSVCLVWFGLVWFGLVWFGLVCFVFGFSLLYKDNSLFTTLHCLGNAA